MLTQIAERVVPPFKGPTTELDHRILAVLQPGRELEPREIYAEIEGIQIQLPQVHSRLRVLTNRGAVTRIDIPTGPSRGPGAGKYRRT